MAVKLGSKVRDKITGFAGILVARTMWLTGCVRVGIEAETRKPDGGEMLEWFDEARITQLPKSQPGGPMPVDCGRQDPR